MTPSIDLTAVSKRLWCEHLEQRDWARTQILDELRRCHFTFRGAVADFLQLMGELGWQTIKIGHELRLYAPHGRLIASRQMPRPSVWY